MRKFAAVAVFGLLVCSGALTQGALVKVRVKAALVTRDLNQKAVPHLRLEFTDLKSSDERVVAKTNLDGGGQ